MVRTVTKSKEDYFLWGCKIILQPPVANMFERQEAFFNSFDNFGTEIAYELKKREKQLIWTK